MSKMFPEYDKAAWETLAATITAGSSRTATSTYASVDTDSTASMSAGPGATTALLCYVAFEKAKNRTHLMYWYST